jgi:hypothetical protein
MNVPGAPRPPRSGAPTRESAPARLPVAVRTTGKLPPRVGSEAGIEHHPAVVARRGAHLHKRASRCFRRRDGHRGGRRASPGRSGRQREVQSCPSSQAQTTVSSRLHRHPGYRPLTGHFTGRGLRDTRGGVRIGTDAICRRTPVGFG